MPRFAYHATAIGVGARFTRIDRTEQESRQPVPNVDHVVPVQGASVLPTVGGLSESTAGPFEYRVSQPRELTLVRVGKVHTRTSSQYPHTLPHEVRAEVQVSEVAFLDRIQARYIAARLTTRHDGRAPQPSIAPGNFAIEGLSLDGYPILVKFDVTPFSEFPTREGLRKNFKKLAPYGHQLALPEKAVENWGREKKCDLRKNTFDRGPVNVCTIVTDIDLGRNPPREIQRTGVNRITWKGVGDIYLGELLVSDHFRQLTMMRVDFGSPVGGFAVAGEVQSNSGPVQNA
jgi:hypothetical protein